MNSVEYLKYMIDIFQNQNQSLLKEIDICENIISYNNECLKDFDEKMIKLKHDNKNYLNEYNKLYNMNSLFILGNVVFFIMNIVVFQKY